MIIPYSTHKLKERLSIRSLRLSLSRNLGDLSTSLNFIFTRRRNNRKFLNKGTIVIGVLNSNEECIGRQIHNAQTLLKVY